jgi:hypothetical protein
VDALAVLLSEVLRQSFVEYAGESIKHSEWAKAFYVAQKAKGKKHQAAVRALAYKWIRIIWKCWQTRTNMTKRDTWNACERRVRRSSHRQCEATILLDTNTSVSCSARRGLNPYFRNFSKTASPDTDGSISSAHSFPSQYFTSRTSNFCHLLRPLGATVTHIFVSYELIAAAVTRTMFFSRI